MTARTRILLLALVIASLSGALVAGAVITLRAQDKASQDIKQLRRDVDIVDFRLMSHEVRTANQQSEIDRLRREVEK